MSISTSIDAELFVFWIRGIVFGGQGPLNAHLQVRPKVAGDLLLLSQTLRARDPRDVQRMVSEAWVTQRLSRASTQTHTGTAAPPNHGANQLSGPARPPSTKAARRAVCPRGELPQKSHPAQQHH